MSYDSEVLADSPLAYWKGNDTAGPMVDSVSAYNLVANAAPTFNSHAGPILSVASDKGVGFVAASSQYCQAAGNTTFALGNAFTIEAWVKMTTKAVTSGRQSILANTGASATPALEIGGQGTIGNRVCMTVPGSFICETDDWAVGIGTWAHIVYTRTSGAAGAQKIYVNGVAQNLRTDAATTCVDTAAAWAIGRRTNATQFFNGDIARVAIYGSALSQARVLAHLAAAQTTQAALTYSPPVLVNPIVKFLPTPAVDQNLAAGVDYILVMPKTAALTPGTSGAIWISGGRNVVIVGGEVDISGVVSPDETNARFLYVQNNTGTVYIEGVWVHGSTFTEGLDIFSLGTTYIQQNCRFDGLGPINGSIHPDLMYFSRCAGVYVDGFTGDSQYQGISIVGDTGVVGPQEFRRVNLSETAGTGPMFWQATRANNTLIDRVYSRPALTRALAIDVTPNSSDPTFPASTSSTDGTVTWPGPTNLTGTLTPGTPPYGDYVPAGLAGRSYVGQKTVTSDYRDFAGALA